MPEMPDSENEDQKGILKHINTKVTSIAANIERTQIADYVHLMNSPRKLIWTNLLAGVSRGVGIAIGFTVFTTTIVYLLQALGALNLPIIGDFIAELVKHVQFQLERDGYRY
jgi:hypothetical protein